MNGYFVWDKADNFKRLAETFPSGASQFAETAEQAALQYASQWGYGWYENDDNSGWYTVHVMPEAIAKQIFEKYPEDLMEERAIQIAEHFRGVVTMEMEPITLEELEEDEEDE